MKNEKLILINVPQGNEDGEEHLPYPIEPEKSEDEKLLERTYLDTIPMEEPTEKQIQVPQPEPEYTEEPLIPPVTDLPSEATKPKYVEEPMPVPVEKLPDYKPNKKGNE